MGAKLGPMVFSSVIAPEDPADGKLVQGAQPQITRAFDNMKLFMKAAGGSDGQINHAWVFMKDFAFQHDMVERWVKDYPNFGDRPSRKTLPYDLAGESQIQVQLTGRLGGRRKNYEVPGVGHDDPIPMGSSIGPLLQSSGMFGIDPATGAANLRIVMWPAAKAIAARSASGPVFCWPLHSISPGSSTSAISANKASCSQWCSCFGSFGA